MSKNIHDEFLRLLEKAIQKAGNASRLAEAIGENPNLVTRWLKRERIPTLAKIQPIIDMLGLELIETGTEPVRDVCFVKPQIVPAGEKVPPPIAEDYIAAPLVGEVGAGQAYFPQEEVKSWFMAWKHQAAIRHRRNLIAVEIAKGSDSMQPTICPGDIVLVDRDDRDPSHANRMMLVLDPDGAGMVKRVSVRELKDDFQITFSSDNAAKWAPVTYSLVKDYMGDWDKAIAGRVIWAWADVREK